MGAVLLVRHGQASFGTENYDRLSDKGFRQSAIVGAELSRRVGGRVAAVYSGSLLRQRDTATAALRAFGGAPVVREDPRWNEYDHLALFAGGSTTDGPPPTDPRRFQTELDARLAEWVDGGRGAAGESWIAFTGRVRAALLEAAGGLGKGENALVFTSGGVIAAAAGQLAGAAGPMFLALNRVSVNAGITKLVTGRSGISLVSFNEHGHFDGQAAELLSYR